MFRPNILSDINKGSDLSRLSSLKMTSMSVGTEALAIYKPATRTIERLVALVDDARDFINAQLKANGDFDKSKIDDKFVIAINRTEFVNLATIPMAVPSGMSATWLEIATLLVEAQAVSNTLYDDILYPFSQYIGQIINDPKKITSATHVPNLKSHNLTAFNNRFSTMFKLGNVTSRPYSKCIVRNSDWSPLAKKLDALVEGGKVLPQSIVVANVNDLDTQMNALMDTIRDPSEQFRPTSSAINNLSNLSYTLAEEVHFYAMVHAHINLFIKSMNNAKDNLLQYID